MRSEAKGWFRTTRDLPRTTRALGASGRRTRPTDRIVHMHRLTLLCFASVAFGAIEGLGAGWDGLL
ncbi:MAG: hypothetical protein ACREND_14175 [Gemmatimonadaceae bacterium]